MIRHGVEAAVELAVSRAGEPVTHDVAGGGFDGRGSGVGGEGRGRSEPVDVPDPGQDLPGGLGRDANQVGQGGPAVLYCFGDLGVGGGDPSVEVADLTNQLDSELPEGARAGLAWADRPEELGCGVGGEVCGVPRRGAAG